MNSPGTDKKVEFHPDAAERFNQLAAEILRSVGAFGNAEPARIGLGQLHPVANITSADIVGQIELVESAVNGLGEEMGRFWNSKGLRVGWEGNQFQAIKDLAARFEKIRSIEGRVSRQFLLDEISSWLRETLERNRTDMLTDYVAQRCSEEIRDYEIWIPIYRSYSANEFAIGDVQFRVISKAMLDKWYADASKDSASEPVLTYVINRERAAIQGSVAACVKVNAEVEKARQIAQTKAAEAVGLLRLLSPVNWTCKLVSYCLPVGKENTQSTLELFVKDGAIENTSKGTIEHGPSGWNIDEARCRNPGLLEALNHLASNREATGFRRDLYETLLLYSRHSISAEISHKIVFVTAALESLLLKDSHEPIQKNLGERMAFLIGSNLAERKDVVSNVEAFYDIRSRFVHHGREVSSTDTEIVDKFFVNAWFCLTRLLPQVSQYATKSFLIDTLEDRKLS